MIKKVKIGPHTYTVRYSKEDVSGVSEEVRINNSDGVEAYSDHQKLEIVLLPGGADQVDRMSLLHEILHCCLRASGNWPDEFARILTRSRGESNIDVEEYVIGGTTGPLLQTIRDNPELTKYLLG